MPAKRVYKKRTYRKKKMVVPRKKLSGNEVFFRRKTFNSIGQASSLAPTEDNYFFSLSLLPSVTDISNMFAKVKLLSVDCKWCPRATVSTLSASTLINTTGYAAFNPSNDGTGTVQFNDLLTNSKAKSFNITKPFKIRIYPVLKTQVGVTSVTTCYIDKPSSQVFIDTKDLAVRFYGMDWIIPNTGLASGYHLGDWELTYNIVAKNVI